MSGDTWSFMSSQDSIAGCKNFRELQQERYEHIVTMIKNGCPCRSISGEAASCTLNKTRVCEIELTSCPILFSAQISRAFFQTKLW